jgi:hypothetical protein
MVQRKEAEEYAKMHSLLKEQKFVSALKRKV